MALQRKLSGSPVEVYKAWVNSCLEECGGKRTITDLAEELKDGIILCQLIKLTTGHNTCQWEESKDQPERPHLVELVLDFMKSKGIDITCKVEDITNGKLKFILDILWLIILHFEIHSASRAAYQRTVNLGKRFLLEWCCSEIPNSTVDPRGPFLDFLQDGVLLTKLITKYCPVDGIDPNDLQVVDKSTLRKVLKAAEDKLGIFQAILSSSGILDDDTFDEYAVIIYMAILRRKICAMNGEEPTKGGTKPESSPSKQRHQVNGMDTSLNYSPSKYPHNKTTLADSPLSPKALRSLVDQHTKSHAAIQALQERIQAVSNQASTPRLQKKLPEGLLIKDMAPTPTDGMTSSSSGTDGDVNCKKTESFPIAVIPTDQNENFLAVNGDKLFVDPATNGDTSEELYTSVDKEFLELMLDAVQKGFMPPELATAETWLNHRDATEDVSNGSAHLLKGDAPSVVADCNGTSQGLKQDASVENSTQNRAVDKDVEPSLTGAVPISASEQQTSASVGPTLLVNEALGSGETRVANEASNNNGPSLGDLGPQATTVGPLLANAGQSQNGNIEDTRDNVAPATALPLDSVEPNASTSNKKVQFLGLNTVFGVDSKAADDPVDISVSPSHPINDTGLDNISQSSPKTVTWATLDSPVITPRLASGKPDKSHLRPIESLHMFETALYTKESDAMSDGDQEDPFMIYLNSIEQTALKFKVQVEQAKVDTLEALKEKLERAYEGTPLEEIPLKFREKLQETISEIASDEVLKKYQSLVVQDEEITEEENAILECMRNELDSVACENFELHQQLELLKDYERRYFELKDNFDSLNNGISTIKNEYEKKNGESEFLAERVESLEKSIVNLRVQYSNEITDLQNENLQLQTACLELENKNTILEEEIDSKPNGFNDSQDGESERRHFAENWNKTSVADQRELEMLQLRLEELEKQNNALRAASQADQAMIQCVEEKKEELEKSLIKAQDDHSKVLLELHEAQRQISSDRVKISSYHEEVDALRRENNLLNSSLDIAQKELEYHLEKKESKEEPWKSNKRMIWKEIRELEKILKGVHREKRNLEKKYVSFKHDNDPLNGSFSFHSCSSSGSSPEREQCKDEKEKLKSKSWHSSTETENNKASPKNGVVVGNDDSFSSPPLKVRSWLDGLRTPNGLVKGDVSFDRDKREKTPVLSERELSASGSKSPRKEENGCHTELEELRHHVGSLEAEKAAIVKELSSLRFSRIKR